LDVDAAGVFDLFFVGRAEAGDVVHVDRAVGDVDVVRGDVDVVEEMLVHEPHIALEFVRLHRPILIKVECHHVLKRQALVAVQTDQLAVHAGGRRTRRQA